jgi:hypothetical protein
MKLVLFVFILISALSLQALACGCAAGGEKTKSVKTTAEETK